jgi:HSP20 family molecular chaperone IbpA
MSSHSKEERMMLTRYNPFRGFDETGLQLFQDTLNRFFSEPETARPWTPHVDVVETKNEIVVKADVPGVEEKDIDIKLENGTLTLKGERKLKRTTRRRATIALNAATARSCAASASLTRWSRKR